MRHREAEPHSRFYHFEAVMGVERRTPQGTTTAEVFRSSQIETEEVRSKECKPLSGRPRGQNQTQVSVCIRAYGIDSSRALRLHSFI